MEHLEFVVKCYNKQELAQMYFPDLTIRKHPIKYTLYFHKIENSISTLVKS